MTRAISLVLRALRAAYGSRPVPLWLVMRLVGRAGEDTSALTRNRSKASTGEAAEWAMHPDAVAYLDRELRRIEPGCVLEFGSGSSTIWLATLMKEIHGASDSIRLLSIEQDEQTASSVRRRLTEVGLERSVGILVAPLTKARIWGEELVTYSLPRDEVEAFVGSSRPDVVLIDGPAGEPGARFGTLPQVIDLLAPGARFFLDDALRSGELWVAERWGSSGRIEVHGVHLIGRGLASGRTQAGSG